MLSRIVTSLNYPKHVTILFSNLSVLRSIRLKKHGQFQTELNEISVN